MQRQSSRLSLISWQALLIAVAYAATGKLGLELASSNPSSTAVWAPSGIALAAILIAGYRVWPAIFVAAFFVNATSVLVLPAALGIATGNTLEALIGAYLLNRFAQGRRAFERVENVFRFIVLAALLSTIVSATIGVVTLSLSHAVQQPELAKVWLTWWLGDAVGIMVIAPLLILWAADPAIHVLRERVLEVSVLIAATIIVGALVFNLTDYPLTVICIPPVIWAAFRLSQRETAGVVLLSAAVAVAGTVTGHGPFHLPGRNVSMLLLEAYMAALAGVALPITAMIQQRKRAEQDAVQANRAKDEFMAMVSHELRNPVNTIVLATHTLRELPPDSDRGERVLQTIEKAAQLLTNRTNELLESTRIVTGTFLVERRPVDLVTIAKGALEMMQPLAESKQLVLSSRIVPTRAIVHGDTERIHQAIVNLLNNAIKFTPAKGTVELALVTQRDEVKISVTDSGAGIAPDFLPHVFERHAQSTRSRTGGLGLGLFIVKHLVEAHGGRVEARSDGLGSGATFTVSLPLDSETPAEAIAEEPSPIFTTRRTA